MSKSLLSCIIAQREYYNNDCKKFLLSIIGIYLAIIYTLFLPNCTPIIIIYNYWNTSIKNIIINIHH